MVAGARPDRDGPSGGAAGGGAGGSPSSVSGAGNVRNSFRAEESRRGIKLYFLFLWHWSPKKFERPENKDVA